MSRNAHIRIIYLPQRVAYIISWCGLCLLHTVGSPELLAIREPQQDNKPKYPHLFFICKPHNNKSLLPGIEWHINHIMAINTIKLDVPFTKKEKYVIAANLTCLVADTPKGNQFIYDAFQELNIDHYEMRRIIPEIVKTEGQDGFFRIISAMSSNKKKVAQQYFGKALIDGDGKNTPNAVLIFQTLLDRCGLRDAIVEVPMSNINVRLDSSVKSITRTAACHLSSVIANGIMLAQNNDVVIYKDRIDFGRCSNPKFQGMSGNIAPNFYMEYGNVIYRFGSNLKCGWFNKQIDYVGTIAPTSPDNLEIFNLIYPRFA